MVDIFTNADELSVRECINEVLITRIEDLRCEDFGFVKVKDKKVSTPAYKKGQEIGQKHFCIGTPYIPSYLGERKISVGFARDPRAIYPKANTCYWKVQLPTCYTYFPAFKESFDKCLEIEAQGFMIA